jgi:Tfp pilus assembly protein PilW
MASKITSIEPNARPRRAAFVLSEMIVATGITALLMVSLVAFFMFAGQSFAAMFNYADLDGANRIAMDTLTTDLRQCNKVTACTTNNLTLQDYDGVSTLSYTYDPAAKTLVRTRNGASATTLLKGCTSLTFTIAQRNPVGGSYDVYPAATAATAKVVNISWICSRSIFGNSINTEAVQTARIVIRRQGT